MKLLRLAKGITDMTYLARHEKLKAGERAIAVCASRRDYVYRAFVDRRTGKLIRVTAGCRNWTDFEHAMLHYSGDTTQGRKWSDSLIDEKLAEHYGHGIGNFYSMFTSDLFKTYLDRAEARAVLRKLQQLVKRNINKRYRLNMKHRTEKMRATRARNKRLGVARAT